MISVMYSPVTLESPGPVRQWGIISYNTRATPVGLTKPTNLKWYQTLCLWTSNPLFYKGSKYDYEPSCKSIRRYIGRCAKQMYKERNV